MHHKKDTIVVPWDFSQIAEYALSHAIPISRILENDIAIVHIIDEGSVFSSSSRKRKEIENATQKLNEVSAKIISEHKIKPKVIVQSGNIFNTINKIAEEENANMVIMGTHGMTGMQKITGSRALKVIVGSKVPYMVVQAPYEYRDNNDIVFPVDFRTENKEKLLWANYMAKSFKSKIQIFTPNVTDELLKKRTTANLNFAKKFLKERNVLYEITTAEGKGNFAEEIIKFAHTINTNLILIMTTRNIGLQDYIVGTTEQYVISNSMKISVMCVNPRSDVYRTGGFG
ncbi:MAG: universal stress protein [Bacteroidetes bacterium]|jgi:nucleotide-binding universal stress UspA family protein|nr:universal stress protein [Bacteroidota bacterium]MBT6686292.1 universal stress protein [Bacteroidota bacterium]MBT7145094.1 universal stress protein [Bacteroidota bacterium]